MKHLDSELIANPEAEVVAHLETCNRCRGRVSTDVDIAAVRQRVLNDIGTQPATEPRRRRGVTARWYERPAVVASVAATTVILLVAPIAWIGLQDGGDSTQPAPPVTASPEVAPAPAVVLPEHPEDSPQDRMPFVPGEVGDVASFEMAFAAGDTVAGRLIWNDPSFFELYQIDVTPSGPEFGYHMYRAGTESGWGDPDGSEAATAAGERQLPDDPDIPWDLLINPRSDTEMWTAIAGDAVDAVKVEVTHPAADRAWEQGAFRLEVTTDGIPVVVNRPNHPAFVVTSFDTRPIRAGEVGNNTDLPFNYALFLAQTTTDEQRHVLENGIVTFSDYEAAAENAATCSGTETTFNESTGVFDFSDGAAADCAERHVDDIAAVWRLDSQWVDDAEWTEIWYLVEGEAEAAEMYRAEAGPERPLASGNGWALSIAQRGTGLCTYEEAMGFGEGCFVPSQMLIPHVLKVSVGVTYDDGAPSRGSIVGVVVEGADKIIVTFQNGNDMSIVPGHISEFGFRGYGTLFDASELGLPTTIVAYNGDHLLGETTLDTSPFRGDG